MKRIIQAVVVGALFTGAQAQAEDAPIVLPAQWSHADRLPAGAAQASAFPGASREDPIVVESKSTYAERHAGMSQDAVASAFPGAAREDPITVESMSTHADEFATERSQHARGASDPALSQ